jgi:hypothetical protein
MACRAMAGFVKKMSSPTELDLSAELLSEEPPPSPVLLGEAAVLDGPDRILADPVRPERNRSAEVFRLSSDSRGSGSQADGRSVWGRSGTADGLGLGHLVSEGQRHTGGE